MVTSRGCHLSLKAPLELPSIQMAADRSVETLRQAALCTAAVELHGGVDIPAPGKGRATDKSCADPGSFCGTYWSSMLPQGYTTARRRAESPYDADVLEFFRDLARVEHEYATALQRLSERVVRDPEAAEEEVKSGGSRWRSVLGKDDDRPLMRSLQYSTMQHGWSTLQASLRAQAKEHLTVYDDMRAAVIEPLKAAVKQERSRREQNLAPADQRLQEVQHSRIRAAQYVKPYREAMARYRKDTRARGVVSAGSQEAALLFEAASACSEAVRAANEDTALFTKMQPQLLSGLQEHEERRLESVGVALSAFASIAQSTTTWQRVEELRDAVDKIDVPADICGFAATCAPPPPPSGPHGGLALFFLCQPHLASHATVISPTRRRPCPRTMAGTPRTLCAGPTNSMRP